MRGHLDYGAITMTIVAEKCTWIEVVVEVAFVVRTKWRCRNATQFCRTISRCCPHWARCPFGVTIRCVEGCQWRWIDFRKQHIGCLSAIIGMQRIETSTASRMCISSTRSDFLITTACTTIIVTFCELCDHDMQQHYHHYRRHRYTTRHIKIALKSIYVRHFTVLISRGRISKHETWTTNSSAKTGRCMLACLRHVTFSTCK